MTPRVRRPQRGEGCGAEKLPRVLLRGLGAAARQGWVDLGSWMRGARGV